MSLILSIGRGSSGTSDGRAKTYKVGVLGQIKACHHAFGDVARADEVYLSLDYRWVDAASRNMSERSCGSRGSSASIALEETTSDVYWLALNIATRPATKTPTAQNAATKYFRRHSGANAHMANSRKKSSSYASSSSHFITCWVRSGALNFPDGSLA